MRHRVLWIGILAILLFARPVAAQDSGSEKSDAQWKKELRERVLKRVQDRLDRESKRIREDIERILDEELGPADEGGTDEPSKKEDEKSGAAPSKDETERLKKAMKKFLDESTQEEKKGTAAAHPDEETDEAVEERAFLGVATAPVGPALRRQTKLEEGQGVLVQEVVEDAPASAAGLSAGDIILGIDGQEVGSPQELSMIIQSSRPGEKATLNVLRKGEKIDVPVTYGKRPGMTSSRGGAGDPAEEDLAQDEPESPAPPAAKSGKTPKFEDPPAPRRKGEALTPEELRDKVRKFLEEASSDEATAKQAEEKREKMKRLLEKTEGDLEGAGEEKSGEGTKEGGSVFMSEEWVNDLLAGLDERGAGFEDSLRQFRQDLRDRVTSPEAVQQRGEWRAQMDRLSKELSERMELYRGEFEKMQEEAEGHAQRLGLSEEDEEAAPEEAWFGVAPAQASDALRTQLGLGGKGAVLFSEVIEDSPAEKAGLEAHDVVISLDGKPVESVHDLAETIASHRPGDRIEVEVIRKGERQKIQVTLDRRPR